MAEFKPCSAHRSTALERCIGVFEPRHCRVIAVLGIARRVTALASAPARDACAIRILSEGCFLSCAGCRAPGWVEAPSCCRRHSAGAAQYDSSISGSLRTARAVLCTLSSRASRHPPLIARSILAQAAEEAHRDALRLLARTRARHRPARRGPGHPHGHGYSREYDALCALPLAARFHTRRMRSNSRQPLR